MRCINDGPIDAKAELSDGALKLTLGPTGYYGMQNGAVQFRDIDGKLTAYKYLVVRMKGEKGQENVSGNGVLMMSIGGGDGSHIGTFNAEAAGGPTPFLDPDGKTMPTITTEYQDSKRCRRPTVYWCCSGLPHCYRCRCYFPAQSWYRCPIRLSVGSPAYYRCSHTLPERYWSDKFRRYIP